LYYFPLSRLFTGIGGAIGAYIPNYNGNTGNLGLYWCGGAEIGFRFTPGFTLAANAGYRQFQADNGVFNSGFYAGLTAQITFQTGNTGNREALSVSFDQPDAVYPAFM